MILLQISIYNALNRLSNRTNLLYIIVTILTHIGLFLRSYPPGTDSYYYLMAIRGDIITNLPPLFIQIHKLFPYTELFTIITPLIATFITLVLLKHIAKELNIKNYTLAPILVVTSIQLLARLSIFEDELLGLPLCLTALYFLLKSDKHRLCYVGFAIFTALALISWRGSLIFLIVFILLGLIKINNSIMWFGILTIIPLFPVVELANEQSIGVLHLLYSSAFLLFGLYSWKESDNRLKTIAIVFISAAIINSKWIWLAAIPLGFLATNFIDKIKNKEKINDFLAYCLIYGLLLGNLTLMLMPPCDCVMNSMKYTASITGGEEISNNWSFGYWLQYYGANAKYTPATPTIENHNNSKYILTECTLDLPILLQFQWVASVPDLFSEQLFCLYRSK